jgi:hypothetical protein
MRAFLATLLLAWNIDAAAAQSCVPADITMAIVQTHPTYQSHHVASEAEARIASDIFNAAPPESDIRWTLAILVSFRDGSGGLLVGREGLICGSLRFAPASWPAFERSVRGSGV